MVYSVYDLETQTAETLIALGPGLIIGSGVLYYDMWRIEHNDGKHSFKQLLLCIFYRPTKTTRRNINARIVVANSAGVTRGRKLRAIPKRKTPAEIEN